jgi:hypothetical protein
MDLQVEGADHHISWSCGDQVELQRDDGERWSAHRIAALDHHVVAQRALAERYMPTTLTLELGYDDDLVYDFKLRAPDCQISALRNQPGPEQASTDYPLMESVWMRTANVRTLYRVIEALFEEFCQEVVAGAFNVEQVRRSVAG